MDIRFGDSAATGSDQRRILIRDHGREPERDEFSSGRLIACADTPPDLILRSAERASRRMGHGRHRGNTSLVPRHSDYDWLIPSQFRMGRSPGATRTWMLRATPG